MGKQNWKHLDKGNEKKKKQQEIPMDPDKRRLVYSRPKYDPLEDAIKKFEGSYEFLSNIFKSNVWLVDDEKPYPSVEHAFQASKTSDLVAREKIREEPSAIQSKKLARDFEISEQWRTQSQSIMEALVRDKFRRHRSLRRRLLQTGHVRLVYTNEHNDVLWGMCNGKGKNILGKLLEKVRDQIADGSEPRAWLKARVQLQASENCFWHIQPMKEDELLDVLEFSDKAIVSFGRADDANVRLNHPSISRLHAFLFADRLKGGMFMDLGTPNGCTVDGHKIEPFAAISISPEHVIRIGTSSRRFRATVFTNMIEKRKHDLYVRMSQKSEDTPREEVKENTVYVGNLVFSITKEQVEEFFRACGVIKTISLPRHRDSGEAKGIAFIQFSNHISVAKALQLDGDELLGRSIKVKRHEVKKPAPKQEKSPERERPQDAQKTSKEKTEKKPKIKVIFKANDKAYYGKEKVRVVGVHLDKKRMRPYYTIKLISGRTRPVLEHMISRKPMKKTKPTSNKAEPNISQHHRGGDKESSLKVKESKEHLKHRRSSVIEQPQKRPHQEKSRVEPVEKGHISSRNSNWRDQKHTSERRPISHPKPKHSESESSSSSTSGSDDSTTSDSEDSSTSTEDSDARRKTLRSSHKRHNQAIYPATNREGTQHTKRKRSRSLDNPESHRPTLKKRKSVKKKQSDRSSQSSNQAYDSFDEDIKKYQQMKRQVSRDH